ncbi:MAG: hypothetical protein IPM35_28215 [Myxococcales bacterium]|nr:hypothetical protein [Myxococcales bacterium]
MASTLPPEAFTLYGDTKELEKATRAICETLARRRMGIEWGPPVERALRLTFSDEPTQALDDLADVIRRIRKLVNEGRWLWQGEEIVFRIRDPQGPDPSQVGVGFWGVSGPADPLGTQRRILSQGLLQSRQAPLRILVDDEPAEGPHVMRIKPGGAGLPRAGEFRQKLAVQLGHSFPHRTIAALFILFQPRQYFSNQLTKRSPSSPWNVLEDERRAIQKACKAVGIVRPTGPEKNQEGE